MCTLLGAASTGLELRISWATRETGETKLIRAVAVIRSGPPDAMAVCVSVFQMDQLRSLSPSPGEWHAPVLEPWEQKTREGG